MTTENTTKPTELWKLQPDGTWANEAGSILPHDAFPEPVEGQDSWSLGLAITTDNTTKPEAPERKFDHFSIVPFRAICGADVSNQSTTQTPECATCWQYFKEWESSRRADSAAPTGDADDHVAWCRYTYDHTGGIRSIVTCDSDAKGAFKVYRR